MDIFCGTAQTVPAWVQPGLTGAAILVSAAVAPVVMVLQRRAKIRDARDFAIQTVAEFVALVEMVKFSETTQDGSINLGPNFPGQPIALMDEHLKAASTPDLANSEAFSIMFMFRSMTFDLGAVDQQPRESVVESVRTTAWTNYEKLGKILKKRTKTRTEILAEIAENNPDWPAIP